MKENVPEYDGRNDPDKIGNQSAGKGIAGVLDINGTEIHGQDIEGCFGRPLHDTGQAPHKRIGSVMLHGLYHQPPGCAAAQGFHESHGQGWYKIGIHAQQGKKAADLP